METRDLAGRIIKAYGLDMSVSRFLMWISNYKTGLNPLVDARRETESTHDMPDDTEKLKTAFHVYQRSLRDWNALDFDDILLEALRLVREKAEENRKHADAGQFSYLMVDEFQDISPCSTS